MSSFAGSITKSPEAKERFLSAVYSCKGKYRKFLNVEAGGVEKSSEPVADNSYDLAFIIRFKSKADLEAYLTHPLHVEAVNRDLKPATQKSNSLRF